MIVLLSSRGYASSWYSECITHVPCFVSFVCGGALRELYDACVERSKLLAVFWVVATAAGCVAVFGYQGCFTGPMANPFFGDERVNWWLLLYSSWKHPLP